MADCGEHPELKEGNASLLTVDSLSKDDIE
jgi:hypothetical protein